MLWSSFQLFKLKTDQFIKIYYYLNYTRIDSWKPLWTTTDVFAITSIHNQFRINGGVFITKSVFAYYSIILTGIYRLSVIKRVGLKSGLFFILINLGYLKKFCFLSRLGRLHYAQMTKLPWLQPEAYILQNIYIFTQGPFCTLHHPTKYFIHF